MRVLHSTDCRSGHTDRSGFTLIEVLLAMAISAIVLAAIGGVFFSAFRLRDRTAALLDESAPVYQAVSFLRRDLLGALPPGGLLAGDFRCGTGTGIGMGSGASTGAGSGASSGLSQNLSLQFSTTTGLINSDLPTCDIQEIVYELRDAGSGAGRGNKQLIRSVARNVLTSGILETDDQPLLSNVESVEFACYDGYQWRDTWDTSLSDTNLPTAVRIRVQLAGGNLPGQGGREPVEMVFPLWCQSRTNQLASAGGGQ
jgi:prepilin-type N-terminal cleavage/methylation domain-containing protein